MKKEISKQGQTKNKAKQHKKPKAVTFLKKNELPRVGYMSTMYIPDSLPLLHQLPDVPPCQLHVCTFIITITIYSYIQYSVT